MHKSKLDMFKEETALKMPAEKSEKSNSKMEVRNLNFFYGTHQALKDVSIDIDERTASRMEVGKQGVLFYIVEEAVNNARKHASAPHIWVRLKLVEENMALLEVQDNGHGFDVEAVNASYENRGSLGLINLKERTELVSGLLNIKSGFGEGTTVQVYIPLTEESADRLKQVRSP